MDAKESEAALMNAQNEKREREQPPPPYDEPKPMGNIGAAYTPMAPQNQYPGTVNPSTGVVYEQQPQVVVVAPPCNIQEAPNDYKSFALMVSIFCCWPIGVCAVRKSKECRDAIMRGDIAEAETLSRQTKKLANKGLWIGVLGNIIAIALVVVLYIYWLGPLLRSFYE